jgi:ParB-like chromosome segregation protein Spo0J
MEAIMQWLMKCCARGALGLGAAALLLAGVPAHAQAAAGAIDAASRESQPRLLAQSTTQPGEAEQLEKRRLEEQRQKAEKEKQQVQERQQTEPKKAMKTRGAMPEAAPEAKPSAPGGKRFGAGVVRHGDTGEAE